MKYLIIILLAFLLMLPTNTVHAIDGVHRDFDCEQNFYCNEFVVLKERYARFYTPDQYMPRIIGYITSNYGYRMHPLTKKPKFHRGVDIRSKRNTLYNSPANGVVIFSGWKTGYGNTIIIDHLNGYKSLVAHNAKNLVEVGEYVTRATIIAKSGSTGVSTAPHIHFEVIKDGVKINPTGFVLPE